MEILFLPFKIFVWFPPLALLPSGAFIFLFKRSNGEQKKYLYLSLLWLLYTIYECLMWYWAKGVTAPIRVDLILIAPVMILASIATLIRLKRKPKEDV